MGTSAAPSDLAASYEQCRQVHRRHGRTYYLATRLLPAWKRRHVHALYGFARYADEIVDSTESLPVAERSHRLARWSERFLAGLGGADGLAAAGGSGGAVADSAGGAGGAVADSAGGAGDSGGGPLLPAVLHTVRVFNLDLEDFRKFLESMAMDLTVTEYPTYDDLLGYMEGSAAAIGTMMLPVLQAPAEGVTSDLTAAREPARQLGLAFQLTNFIRDVAEDLDRGRVYLPAEDLERFGVTPAELVAGRDAHRCSPAIKDLIRYEIERARGHYAAAAVGIPMLLPTSRICIRAAYRLYAGILDEVERQDADVFTGRAVVRGRRRLRIVAGAALANPRSA